MLPPLLPVFQIFLQVSKRTSLWLIPRIQKKRIPAAIHPIPDVNKLTDDQVRGCITFLLRQMRNQYAPYPCLASGELHQLLLRWIELNGKEDAEAGTMIISGVLTGMKSYTAEDK